MAHLDIITGFLGAGKTTFANILLDYYLKKGEKVAYIVNEFGDTGLDAQIIRREGFQAVELANGCICCTLKGDFAMALQSLISEYAPNRIIFEPSGIFVFDNFIDILQVDFLKTQCKLNQVITVIDSLNFHKMPQFSGSFIENQIKNADILLVSKLERFTGDRTELICDLKNINENAVLFIKPWRELDEADFEDLTQQKKEEKIFSSTEAGHPHLKSFTFTLHRNFSQEAYQKLIARLSSEKYGTLLRAKGYIKIEEESYLFNYALGDATLKKQSYVEESRLTFIGEGLHSNMLQLLCNC